MHFFQCLLAMCILGFDSAFFVWVTLNHLWLTKVGLWNRQVLSWVYIQVLLCCWLHCPHHTVFFNLWVCTVGAGQSRQTSPKTGVLRLDFSPLDHLKSLWINHFRAWSGWRRRAADDCTTILCLEWCGDIICGTIEYTHIPYNTWYARAAERRRPDGKNHSSAIFCCAADVGYVNKRCRTQMCTLTGWAWVVAWKYVELLSLSSAWADSSIPSYTNSMLKTKSGSVTLCWVLLFFVGRRGHRVVEFDMKLGKMV